MALFSLLFGGLLVGLGLLGYTDPGTLGEFDPNKSRMTALTPAYVGAILIVCGLIVMLKPGARKHAMHAAALIGVIGFAGGFVPLFRSNFDFKKASAVTGLLMSGLAALFVLLCIKSFIDARKARQAAH
jgi:hypothetical protein